MSINNSKSLREPKAVSSSSIHHKIIDIMKAYPPGQSLEFPSGEGLLSFLLEKEGHATTLFDISPDSYSESLMPIAYGNLNEQFLCDDNSYDYAFCIEGPEHVENIFHTFREFYRVLKDDGLLFISMPNYANLESRIKYLFYGIIEPVMSGDQLRPVTGRGHINRAPYGLL